MLVRAQRQIEFHYGQRQRRLEVGETINAEAIHPRELKSFLDAGDLIEQQAPKRAAATPEAGGDEQTGDSKTIGQATQEPRAAPRTARKGRVKGGAAT